MLGVVWPRVQNFKYFSLNHLIPWDLKPTQTPFPPEAGRNWNLEGWKITFPKTFLSHLCCHVRHLEKYRSVWGPGCDSAMLLGDLPLQGVTGWLALQKESRTQPHWILCYSSTPASPLEQWALGGKWLCLTWSFLSFFFVCLSNSTRKQMVYPWHCIWQFCPDKSEPQNFLQVMMKLDMAIYWPVFLIGHSHTISIILSVV